MRQAFKNVSQSQFAYCGALVTEDGRPHIHIVMSAGLSDDIVRNAWPYGYVNVQHLTDLQIEEKVGYMIKNQKNGRSTHGRLFNSRGVKLEREEIPVTDTEDARNKLRDLISPQEPRLVNAQIFGGNPRVSFRFEPVRSDDEEGMEGSAR